MLEENDYTIVLERNDGKRIKLDRLLGDDDSNGFRKVVFGRKDVGGHKKVSRDHVELRYNLESGMIKVRHVGQNPSYLERDELRQMDAKVDYTLSNRDSFWLLQNEFKHTVKISFMRGDDEEDGGKTEEEEEAEPVKKVCKYGAACYRRNPDHLKEFSHPGRGDDEVKKVAGGRTPGGGGKVGDGTPVKMGGGSVNATARNTPKGFEGHGVRLGGGLDERKEVVKKEAVALGSKEKPAKRSSEEEEHEDGVKDVKKVKADSDLGWGSSGPDKAMEEENHDEDLKMLYSDEIDATPPKLEKQETPLFSLDSNVSFQAEKEEDVDMDSPNGRGALDLMDEDVVSPGRGTTLSRLALPAIATRECAFDREKAAKVAVQGSFEVVIVDDKEETLDAYRKAFADQPRVKLVKTNSVSKLGSEHGLECGVVAVETIWRLKPEAMLFSRELHAKAGAELIEALKRFVGTKLPKVGAVCSVEVPKESGLKDEGIQHVLHVISPNRNASRPDPISDEDKALGLLGECYQNVLKSFAEIVGLGFEDGGEGKAVNAFQKLMNGSKAAAKAPPASKEPTRNNYSWDSGLLKYVDAPATYMGTVVKSFDDQVVIIRDVYPKAQEHFLVMPRQKIEGIKDLRKEHLPILAIMKERADALVKEFSSKKFRIGFHAVPSMKHLHMHVISDDFVSVALKVKKHWNSFVTRFFLPYALVRKMVEEEGKVEVDREEYEKLLKGPLVCHKCNQEYAGMKDLKMHLERHLK
ncbi:hypothetical protein HDU97_010004 [Phlyctochytrium planicorne]|nr:hypothetical protein HDU97_010004 [Phlyctochytrium planicorne]